MTPAGERARTIRAAKSRRIRDFWLANPEATIGEAVAATGCVRSACQRWRTKLRKEGKLGGQGKDQADTPAPATSTSTSSPPPDQADAGVHPNDVGFFDRFKPLPPRPKPKPPSSEDVAEASTKPAPEPEPDPPDPDPPEPDGPDPPKQARKDIEFRLW